jgi:membrane protein implicated in regulation of membrane protease activity
MWILVALLILAALGVLGTVLKAVLLVIGAVVLAAVVAGWLGWRAFKRELRRSATGPTVSEGTTTIIIGNTRRPTDEVRRDPGQLPSERDDRY